MITYFLVVLLDLETNLGKNFFGIEYFQAFHYFYRESLFIFYVFRQQVYMSNFVALWKVLVKQLFFY